MKKIVRGVLGPIIENPIVIGLIVLILVIAAIVWFYTQMQETKDAEALKERERGRGDSIWKD